MAFDPHRHHRRSIRLRDYDYRQDGVYYVTICTHARECLFGEITDGEMRRNEYGEAVLACWEAISDHFPQADLDAFVVMPNHVHGILVITDGRGMACHARTSDDPTAPDGGGASGGPSAADGPGPAGSDMAQRQFAQPIAGSLATIIGAFKSAASRRINIMRETPGAPLWHRNYYERIVRDAEMLGKARRYIARNPGRWDEDVNHPDSMTKT